MLAIETGVFRNQNGTIVFPWEIFIQEQITTRRLFILNPLTVNLILQIYSKQQSLRVVKYYNFRNTWSLIGSSMPKWLGVVTTPGKRSPDVNNPFRLRKKLIVSVITLVSIAGRPGIGSPGTYGRLAISISRYSQQIFACEWRARAYRTVVVSVSRG